MRLSAGAVAFAFIVGVSAPSFADVQTVKGEIADQACYKKDKGNKGEAHKDCGTSCVKKGGPVALITASGRCVHDHRGLHREQEREARRPRLAHGRSDGRCDREGRPEDDCRRLAQDGVIVQADTVQADWRDPAVVSAAERTGPSELAERAGRGITSMLLVRRASSIRRACEGLDNIGSGPYSLKARRKTSQPSRPPSTARALPPTELERTGNTGVRLLWLVPVNGTGR